jgi:aldehyde:ferredoxin oxidoreductase
MNSIMGKILTVDLSKGLIRTRVTPKEWIELYTGQKGLATRLLMEDLDPSVDPLSAENRLVLATSIMAGTIVSCSAKLAVAAKSPQTGTISDGSVGGHIGAELKYAGYDGVTITGRAKNLQYLYIDPDRVELRDAEQLKGLGAFASETKIKQMIGDDQVKILTIGPAGENLVRFACICSEHYRQLGRGGLGAVMGSKNLKAIAIRGWLDVRVADIEKCMAVAAEAHARDNILDPENDMYVYGTPVLVDMAQESGLLPTRNFQIGRFEGSKRINGETLKALRKNKKACFSCGIACGNYVQVNGSTVEGPEFETIAICGSNIANGDPKLLIELNALCDDMGMDTISTGGVLACMMEMTEKGIHDFGIRFGDTPKTIEMVRQIAHLQGVGKDAALGTLALAKKHGAPQLAMQIKGMELPGYDPRGSWGMGLAYATAPRGGCHMTTYPVALEAWGNLDPFTFEGKAELISTGQNAQFAKFSMGICDFWPIESKTLGKLFEATYGGSWPEEKVNLTGERIFNLQRMFNVMAGFTGKDDRLPPRFHEEKLTEGPPEGIEMTEQAFTATLKEYYDLRGWDEQGRPTVETLSRLGIEEELIERYRKSLK